MYIDITDDKLKNVNVLFGGRGIGKTFSILKYRILNSYKDQSNMSKFIWLRDSEVVIRKIAAGNSLTAPIERSIKDFPHVEIRKIEGNYVFCTLNENKEIDKILGYLMALSTFRNARGLNYDDVSVIVWDEFIPEEGTIVRYADSQGLTFSNAYETVNRNREFDGNNPVKMIFLSNTNDIYSDVLQTLGLNVIIENLQLSKLNSYQDDDVWIEFFSNEEFYQKKKKTLLYRLNKNEKFKNMSLNNNFNNSMALVRHSANFKGSKGIINLDGKYVLLLLSDNSYYWKVGNYKKLQNYDMNNQQEALLFRFLFADKLKLSYVEGKMFFDSIYTQKSVLNFAKM